MHKHIQSEAIKEGSGVKDVIMEYQKQNARLAEHVTNFKNNRWPVQLSSGIQERRNDQSEDPHNETVRQFGRRSLVWFYDMSAIVGYLMRNPFNTYKQFYF